MIYNLQRFFIFLILIFGTSNLKAQSFPERCEGNWKGNLFIWSQGVMSQNLTVHLTVQKLTDSLNGWIWKTTYFGDLIDPVIKDYTLHEGDTRNGIYVLDEGDGIKLLNYVFGDKMFCVFSYKRTMLTSSYELVGENLIFEVTSGNKINRKKKHVRNFSVDFLQGVIFTRNQ